jgi:phage repressor protein C with HTH and peptisase S24 domain
MDRLPIGPTELARRIGTAKQNIDRWASQARKLPVEAARNLAPHLGVAPEELIFDKKPSAAVQRVPLLSWTSGGPQARNTAPGKRVVAGDLPKGDWIAFRVEGNSMDRIAPDGSIIFVNRKDTALKDKSFYVFGLADGSAIFKRYRAGKLADLSSFSTEGEQASIAFSRETSVIGRVRRVVLDLK